MSLDDVFRKKFENDLRITKGRLIALKKFIIFLKKFKKNPNKYKKIFIQINYFEKHTTCKRIEFNGDEIAKEHSSKIWDTMNLLLFRSNIIYCNYTNIATIFMFRDDSDVYCSKIIEVYFFKN